MQTQGITLGSNNTSYATAYVTLAKITKIEFPKSERTTIDMSALDSPNNFEEIELSKLKRGTDLDFEYNSTEATMAALKTLHELDTVSYFKLYYGGTKFFWWTGYVTKVNYGSGAVDTKVTGNFTVRTTGQVYHQTAAPS
jgi:hypothetical protein